MHSSYFLILHTEIHIGYLTIKENSSTQWCISEISHKGHDERSRVNKSLEIYCGISIADATVNEG